MNDYPHDRVPSGRDIAGAWLFCVLIAGLAFALSAELHRGVPPAATIAASPCARHPASRCGGMLEVTGARAGTVSGLHRVTLPTLPRDLARPG